MAGNLFAYGTLMDEDVMEAVSECRLSRVPAVLEGYSRRSFRGIPYPAVVREEGGRVDGVLYRDVPEQAWERLDRYEGEMYERVPVQVGPKNGERVNAETYVVKDAFVGDLEPPGWDLEEILRDYRKPKLQDDTFRAGVGAVIVDQAGAVLALERSDIAGAWQLPQGGIRKEEKPLDAVFREIREETGMTSNALEFIDEYPEWLAYELPEDLRTEKHGRGQVQRWFLLRFSGAESDIAPEKANAPEFLSWKWTSLERLIEETAPFRRPIYRKLKERFSAHLLE